MVVRDAAEALRLVEGLARASRYGEYRVGLGDAPPVYTTAALIRAWSEHGGALPAPMSSSLWRRESERAAGIEAVLAELRATLATAARRGLIPQSTVADVLRTVEVAATGGQWVGDVSHGPLSR